MSSTTISEATNAIRSRFDTEVAQSLPITTVYDNQDEDTPENDEWVRFSVRWADAVQREFGEKKSFRSRGVAVAQVFVPLGKGDGRALEIADAIVVALRAVSVQEIVTFRTPQVQYVGRTSRSDGGEHWQVNVSCPFFSDTVQ